MHALNRKWDTDELLHQTVLSGISKRKSGTTRVVNRLTDQLIVHGGRTLAVGKLALLSTENIRPNAGG